MDEYGSLSHTTWDCKYHVVFIPKCRRRTLYQELRRHLGEVFRKLALQKESKVEEGHLMPDHVHMLLSIPPKYAVSQVVGFIKGKSAIHVARVYGERKRNFVGQHFWARGFFVNTIGRDEEAILRHTHIFSASRFVRFAIHSVCRDESWEDGAMQGMMDFGRFGDERLKKGGSIFWPPSWANGPRACASLAATGRGRSAFDVFCTMTA